MAPPRPGLPEEPVDLTNCEREPIHIPARIQSFGALIAVSRDWTIVHASENLADMIGLPDRDVVGKPIVDCLSEKAIHDIRSRLQLLSGKDAVERLFGISLADGGPLYDLAIHVSGRLYVIEPFLGLHYPASDIPSQARDLYTRNLLRIISDVSDPGAAVVPAVDAEGQPLDLSMSTTRAVSPIHLEYLRNMGVQASMSISLLRRGKLWGLLACHHYEPRILSYEIRSVAELFGQMFGFILDQIESDIERKASTHSQQVHDRIMANLADGSSIAENFEVIAEAIETVIPFTGAIGWVDGEFRSIGETPSKEEFLALEKFLGATAGNSVFATDCLSREFPPAAAYADRAAGLLALPVSRAPRDYIVLFRHEVIRSVNWAGNPEKPLEFGPNGDRLTPRKSFEAWQQTVKNCCAPWTDSEVGAAEGLLTTLLEVVLRVTDAAMLERSAAQERQEFLIAELNHRVRNILSLIRGLVGQSQVDATDIASFVEVFGGRIHALARAHDQITRQNWNAASCHDLIWTEAAAYLGSGDARIRITGPDAMLQPEAFSALSLVMHELITNAAKYGALAHRSGGVEIDFAEDTAGNLKIAWREHDGPPVKMPTRRGFGSTIIERSIPHELQGQAEIRYDPTGLQAMFVIPAENVAEFRADGGTGPEAGQDAVPQARLSGMVLVVEDNLIIALDAERFMKELGAEDVVMASTVGEALSAVADQPLRFALLDVELGTTSSVRVATDLRDRGVPFAFATGYGETKELKADFPGVPVIQKPYDRDTLARALAQCLPAD